MFIMEAFLPLSLWGLSLILFYYIIKTAVRNGVEQANARLIESVREIEKAVYEIKMEVAKKESI
jgi:hypothetical protein